jgi:hypothetical protein
MGRSMKRLLVAILASAFLVAPAWANEGATRDPNDVRGPLDIKRITHGHRSADVLWHKVVMHNRWGADDLRGDDEIRIHISRDGEDRFDEVHISIDEKNGDLRAWIFPYTEGSDFAGVGPSERIRMTRPNPRVVKVFFEREWVQNRRNRYAWSAGSSYRDRDSAHCTRTCSDYAPGHDPERLVHNL